MHHARQCFLLSVYLHHVVRLDGACMPASGSWRSTTCSPAFRYSCPASCLTASVLGGAPDGCRCRPHRRRLVAIVVVLRPVAAGVLNQVNYFSLNCVLDSLLNVDFSSLASIDYFLAQRRRAHRRPAARDHLSGATTGVEAKVVWIPCWC
jgi:hypothetical protein